MAHYLTNNEKFHIFSKSPVLSSMAVSQAVNKSGHTVSTGDVWADDIPWFTEVADEAGAIARAADARYNDLILWGSDIYVRKGDKTNGASEGTTFAELWQKHEELTTARAYALSSVTTQTPNNIETKTVEIKNSADKPVLKYHVGKQIDLLTTANNANVASTWAARMFIDGKVVDQFVSPTDKVFAGNPSTGYTTLVYTATAAGNKYGFVAEGEADADFVNNAFAGIVQFNQSRNSGHKFAASIFEYVGDKLDATVAALSKAVFGAGTPGEEDQPTSLTDQVLANTQAITKLNGAANVDGSVLHTVETAINALDNTSDQQGSAGISVVQTNGVVAATVTTATVTEGVIDETTAGNVVTASDAKAIADKAASDAITTALADTEGSVITEKIESEIADATLEGKISDSTESTQLVTAEQVVTYVEENAKVTLTQGTGISIDKNGQASTAFTISIDETVALKSEVKDVADDLSEVSDKVTAIETSLASGTIHEEIDAVRQTATAAKATADTAVQSVTRATGSSELITVTDGTDVTISLSTEVATKSDITTEIDKLTAEGGSVKTLQTKVAEIETSLATGGATANAIKAAQDAADAAQEQADKGVADAAAAQGTANTAVTNAATAQAAAEAAQGTADQAVADAATAQAAADAAQAAADAAQADADALETRMDAAESSITATTTIITDLKKVSLAKESADGLVKVSTTGTIGTGLESISVTVSDTIVETTDTFDVTSTGSDNVEVKLTGTVANPSITVKGTDIASATALTALTTKVDTHIASAAKLSIVVVDGLTDAGVPNVAEPETNKLYLVATGAESGTYAEWIYLGDGTWERIGTTATDLSEYAKTEVVTPLITAAQTQADKGVADAATAKSAADAAKSAADAAQADVDALEKLVGTTSVGSQIDTKLSALTDTTAQGGAGVTLTQTNGRVALTVTSGVVAASGTTGAEKFVKGETVHTAIEAEKTRSEAAYAIKGTETVAANAATAAATAQTTAEAKVESITTSDARITLTPTTVNKVKSVAITLASTVATTTDGTAYSKSETDAAVKVASDAAKAADDKAGAAQDAADAAQATADAKIAAVEVTTDAATHFGAQHIEATTDDAKKVTITVTRADEWKWDGGLAYFVNATEVQNGKIINEDGTVTTFDDKNLVNGDNMFALSSKLTTFVSDLGKLTDGYWMFHGCSSLTTFIADLSSLDKADDMFSGCSLSAESLMFIADSIKDWGAGATGHNITIGVDTLVFDMATDETKAEMRGYINEIINKGWNVTLTGMSL